MRNEAPIGLLLDAVSEVRNQALDVHGAIVARSVAPD
jgi:hypothetical protein